MSYFKGSGPYWRVGDQRGEIVFGPGIEKSVNVTEVMTTYSIEDLLNMAFTKGKESSEVK